MSFVSITSGEIASGEPTATTTQTKIKDNFDDHEERIEALEGASSGDPPMVFRVNGYYYATTNLFKTTTSLNINLTGARVIIDTAGVSGTTEIDIKRSRSGGSYTSIFSTLPSVAFGAGNDAISSNGVLDPGMQDFAAGDLLRLDITSAQSLAYGFLVRVDWNRG